MNPTARGARPRRLESGSWLTLIGWVVCLAVLAVVVAGFLEVGGPGQARRENADSERVTSLVALAGAIRQYFAKNSALPTKPSQAFSAAYVSPEDQVDPVTGAPYEYRIIDKRHFELCASFQTDESKESSRGAYGYPNEELPFARHLLGRQCFTLDAKDK